MEVTAGVRAPLGALPANAARKPKARAKTLISGNLFAAFAAAPVKLRAPNADEGSKHVAGKKAQTGQTRAPIQHNANHDKSAAPGQARLAQQALEQAEELKQAKLAAEAQAAAAKQQAEAEAKEEAAHVKREAVAQARKEKVQAKREAAALKKAEEKEAAERKKVELAAQAAAAEQARLEAQAQAKAEVAAAKQQAEAEAKEEAARVKREAVAQARKEKAQAKREAAALKKAEEKEAAERKKVELAAQAAAAEQARLEAEAQAEAQAAAAKQQAEAEAKEEAARVKREAAAQARKEKAQAKREAAALKKAEEKEAAERKKVELAAQAAAALSSSPKKYLKLCEWVQCDQLKCGKWRKIPAEAVNSLPAKWFCRMNIWDGVHASCDAPEEQEKTATQPADAVVTKTADEGAVDDTDGAATDDPLFAILNLKSKRKRAIMIEKEETNLTPRKSPRKQLSRRVEELKVPLESFCSDANDDDAESCTVDDPLFGILNGGSKTQAKPKRKRGIRIENDETTLTPRKSPRKQQSRRAEEQKQAQEAEALRAEKEVEEEQVRTVAKAEATEAAARAKREAAVQAKKETKAQQEEARLAKKASAALKREAARVNMAQAKTKHTAPAFEDAAKMFSTAKCKPKLQGKNRARDPFSDMRMQADAFLQERDPMEAAAEAEREAVEREHAKHAAEAETEAAERAAKQAGAKAEAVKQQAEAEAKEEAARVKREAAAQARKEKAQAKREAAALKKAEEKEAAECEQARLAVKQAAEEEMEEVEVEGSSSEADVNDDADIDDMDDPLFGIMNCGSKGKGAQSKRKQASKVAQQPEKQVTQSKPKATKIPLLKKVQHAKGVPLPPFPSLATIVRQNSGDHSEALKLERNQMMTTYSLFKDVWQGDCMTSARFGAKSDLVQESATLMLQVLGGVIGAEYTAVGCALQERQKNKRLVSFRTFDLSSLSLPGACGDYGGGPNPAVVARAESVFDSLLGLLSKVQQMVDAKGGNDTRMVLDEMLRCFITGLKEEQLAHVEQAAAATKELAELKNSLRKGKQGNPFARESASGSAEKFVLMKRVQSEREAAVAAEFYVQEMASLMRLVAGGQTKNDTPSSLFPLHTKLVELLSALWRHHLRVLFNANGNSCNDENDNGTRLCLKMDLSQSTLEYNSDDLAAVTHRALAELSWCVSSAAKPAAVKNAQSLRVPATDVLKMLKSSDRFVGDVENSIAVLAFADSHRFLGSLLSNHAYLVEMETKQSAKAGTKKLGYNSTGRLPSRIALRRCGLVAESVLQLHSLSGAGSNNAAAAKQIERSRRALTPISLLHDMPAMAAWLQSDTTSVAAAARQAEDVLAANGLGALTQQAQWQQQHALGNGRPTLASPCAKGGGGGTGTAVASVARLPRERFAYPAVSVVAASSLDDGSSARRSS
jgi:hypothetical protein